MDNSSIDPLAKSWDLSWHPNAYHIREDELGLTPARLRGIAEATGGLLVFIDDDNILAPNYLERAADIPKSYSHIGVFGAGILEPEFEEEPEPTVRPWLALLALRSVSQPKWTNNVSDYFCAPHGAGLCVPRRFAAPYAQLVRELRISKVLDRCGENLFCGGDDLFSWLSVGSDTGFGIFPELQITHLISKGRVQHDYIVRLVRAHSFSHAILRYMVYATIPRPESALLHFRVIAQGLKNGWFHMRCKWAESAGTNHASRYIAEHRLQPVELTEIANAEALAN